MTAEVGILNRIGVALAADSAVTVGTESTKKVYNSANKLFSLSKHHPVGIMIYGGANFMSIPWETIIKTYRERLGSEKKNTLKEYYDDFINFIKNDPRLQNTKSEIVLVQRIFNEVFLSLLNEIEGRINDYISKNSVPEKSTVEKWILNLAGVYTEKIKNNWKTVSGFDEDFYTEFKKRHEKYIMAVIDSHMTFKLGQSSRDQLFDMAYSLIVSNIFSNSSSGVVIAGYGEDELFPSMYDCKIEGIINGRLKIIENEPTIIGPVSSEATVTSAIKPFAQQDMVNSFLQGIDPFLEKKIYEILETIMKKFPDMIEQKITGALDQQDKEIIKQLGIDILSYFQSELNQIQKDIYINPVIGIVDILPKEELAAMAEALVNLTSFKRRVSIEAETVGGPIDVAVITKGDGLVWIKRKHYFDPNLNYHFFQNYIRSDNNDNGPTVFTGEKRI
jgi:hypothetical protein